MPKKNGNGDESAPPPNKTGSGETDRVAEKALALASPKPLNDGHPSNKANGNKKSKKS